LVSPGRDEGVTAGFPGQTRAIRVLADGGSARFEQCYQHIEGATAELYRLVVDEQLATVRHTRKRPNAMFADVS
jgi:hypothetical protein